MPNVTPFQDQVYAAVRQIPCGQVASYQEVARHVACGSCRAIGQALRRNPFAPEVPCHRVVAADGRLGGFLGARAGAELVRKRELLAGEGVLFDADGWLVKPQALWRFPGETNTKATSNIQHSTFNIQPESNAGHPPTVTRHPSRRRSALVVTLVALAWWLACPAARAAMDAAPLYQSQAVAEDGADWRAVGPFFSSTTSADGKQTQRALPRPFYTERLDPANARVDRDYLWPFGFSRHRGTEGYEFYLPYLHSFDDTQTPGRGVRHWFMPIYFQGYDRQGEAYHAVFPLGGTVGDLIGYNLTFWMFPFYLETTKGEVHSHAWLWPVFSTTHGPKVDKFRVFPFMGYARTDKVKRSFYLWPFGHALEQYADAKGHYGAGWAVLPLYGRFRQYDAAGVMDYEAWTCLWPLFSGERGGTQERVSAPWPFYRRESGNTKLDGDVTKKHLWPLYGYTIRPERSSAYALWPICQEQRLQQGANLYEFKGLFPLYWEITTYAGGAATEKYRQLWPLCRYTGVTASGRSRFELLSLWPQRRAEPVERNWAPLWTLYSCEQRNSAQARELLWGLVQWRHDAATENSHVSIFPLIEFEHSAARQGWSVGKGLVSHHRQADGTHVVRVLWVTLSAPR